MIDSMKREARHFNRDVGKNGDVLDFDHIHDLRQSLAILQKVQRGFSGSLKNPNLDSAHREVSEAVLFRANYYIDKINAVLNVN
ncbi:hypothetical protein IC620_15250 [Hazenella sp. IB182357]|uniref:Uncharacterized protein n=1 Tax=Polycladospora coralii TaxID=2771432 RepID=A0A926NB84_9BACL|nr:polymorphic toxin type 28 domain-containing protein [Polycladospora coralii]MBD1373701.1 hypothetical protein [Polycladospora coralii]